MLMNARHIGDWRYARTESRWLNKAGYRRQFRREKPLREHFDAKLRIIEDHTLYAAQERIARKLVNDGRSRHGRRGEALPHLFAGLLWCPRHERTL